MNLSPQAQDEYLLRGPCSARIVNHWQGGSLNTPIDRQLAARCVQVHPGAPAIAAVTGKYLEEAVGRLRAEGIRQFLALGCGLPTWIYSTRVSKSEFRVVCVEPDLVARTQVSDILIDGFEGDKRLIIVAGMDAAVLSHPALVSTLDSTAPTGVLMIGPLVPMAAARATMQLVAAMRRTLAPGSAFVTALAIGHQDQAIAVRKLLPDWTLPWRKVKVRKLLARFGPINEVATLTAPPRRSDSDDDAPDITGPLAYAGLAYNTTVRGT